MAPVVTLKMYLRNPRKILTMATLTEPLIQTLTLTQIPSPNLTLNLNTMKET